MFLAEKNDDYTTVEPFRVSFSSSSSTSQSFEVIIADDSQIEPREFFTISISSEYKVTDSDQNTQNLTAQDSSRILIANNMIRVFIINSDEWTFPATP